MQGRILPSTLQNVTLVADLKVENGTVTAGLARVQGESAIPMARQPIERVFLQPEEARAYPEAVRAILDAAERRGLSAAYLEGIFHGNAARLLGAAAADPGPP